MHCQALERWAQCLPEFSQERLPQAADDVSQVSAKAGNVSLTAAAAAERPASQPAFPAAAPLAGEPALLAVKACHYFLK